MRAGRRSSEANASLLPRREGRVLEAGLKTFEDVESAPPRKYTIAWYAAVAGWGVGVLLGLGLVAVVARRCPDSGKSPSPRASPPGPGPPPESPHRIE